MLFAIWYMNQERETKVVVIRADDKVDARRKANKLDYVKAIGVISQLEEK